MGDPATPDFRELSAAVAMQYVPSLVLAGGPPGEARGIALLEGRPMVAGRATAYVCRQYTCEAPTVDAGALAAQVVGAAVG